MRDKSPRITLQPAALRWARERAGLTQEDLAKRLAVKVDLLLDWERMGGITMTQAELLAHKTCAPLGHLYLPEPPDDSLPITDYRIPVGESPRRPSPNLLSVLYAMQLRQAWIREDLTIHWDEPSLDFVGAFTIADAPVVVADAMRLTLKLERGRGLGVANRDWRSALRSLRERIEAAGILIAVDDVAGIYEERKLDPCDFRGIALSDECAPLIFVNGADFISSQMFTMAHELAHIFIGESGVSNLENMLSADNEVEAFCGAVAGEFLLPSDDLIRFCENRDVAFDSTEAYQAVAAFFNVSVIVAARRALDLKLIDGAQYHAFYDEYHLAELTANERRGGSCVFWNVPDDRFGRRFGGAAVRAVKGGRLPYLEGGRLTRLNGPAFDNFAAKLGVFL